ncbi:unnamed protein product [Dovyalis caffra]|uniref:Uncharacterized protein n=1 Tax=Dovyalis caffra TaxID=77055 RepID=A0AAV1RGY7_9ROSI|nr:unnamed protein product [Dovyalis caffra]
MDALELEKRVAEFYDESSGLWGDHMHHGFYNLNAEVSNSRSHHRAAQIRMIEEALSFAGISGLLETYPEKWPKNMVDYGRARLEAALGT